MTVRYNTGFEHGVLSTAESGNLTAPQNGLFSTITGSPTIIAGAARSGSYGLRSAATNAEAQVALNGAFTGVTSNYAVVRFYFRVNGSFPTGITNFLQVAMGGNIQFRVDDTGLVSVRANDGTVDNGPTISVDTWYRAEARVNATANPWVIHWMIDGTEYGPFGTATAVGTLTNIAMGSQTTNTTYSIDIDDVIVGDDDAEYPFGPGYGGVVLPSSLTLATSGTFVQDGTATAVGTGDHVRLDDIPISETTSYIRQTVGSSTQPGGSLKVNFANAVSDAIKAVRVILAYGASATQACNIRAWVAANSTDTYIHGSSSTQPSPGNVGPIYSTVQVLNGGAAWTDSMLDGVQVFLGTGGGTDVNPIPRYNNVILEVDYASATAHSQTLGPDAVGITDAASGVQTALRDQTDAVGLLDSHTAGLVLAATLTDGLGLLDSNAKALTPGALTDPLGLLDAASAVTTSARTQTDPVGLLDAPSRRLDRPLTDPEGLLDSAVAGLVVDRTVGPDGVGLLDAATGAQTAARSQADPEGLLDSQTASSTAERALTDPEGILDSQAQQATLERPLTDPEGLLDAATGTQTAARALTDLLGILDSQQVDAAGGTNVTITDAEGLLDAIASEATTNLSQTDAVGLLDSTAREVALAAALTDAIGLSDTVAVTADALVAVADALGLTDDVTPAVAAVLDLIDALGITDAVLVTSGVSQPTMLLIGRIGAATLAGRIGASSLTGVRHPLTLTGQQGDHRR